MLDSTFSINTLSTILNKLVLLNENKYLRTIHIDDKKPIVEINVSFNTNELNNLFNISLKDDYEINVTFKNTAIMNEIKEINIIINNKTKEEIATINIKENEIIYKNNNDIYKFKIEFTNNDFILKISKNDILYSILNGTTIDDNYKYTYQTINNVYNINILTNKNNNEYSYEILKQKDEEEEILNIKLKIENTYLLERDTIHFIDINNKLINGIYNNDVNYFKNKFINFIN